MRKTELFAILFAIAAATAFAQGDAPDPPSRIARLNYMSGSVSFRPGTVDEWTPATLNYPIYNGDRLWADHGARTELHLGSTALRMDSETALAVLNLDDRMAQLSLTGGTLQLRLRSLGEGESFEVDTPNAAVTLLRAGEYRFFVDGDSNLTTVTVRGGDAEVTAAGRGFVIHAHQSARLSGAEGSFEGVVSTSAPPDDFEFWCQTRDRREEQSQSVRHVSREMIGYEDLDEHGAWSDVPAYGWVWTPRVHAGWAPYHEGRWVWVDPWGWTWVDEAPWGFAPFHYGRWASYSGAWVWVPGTVVARPVYAPALVAFVGGPRFNLSIGVGGGGGGVAWFPLGPHEVYRPAYRVSDVYVRQVNVTHVNVNINVTNVNVTNVRYVNQNVQGGMTAVSRNAFVNARPVQQSAVAVNANAMAQAQVVGAAQVAPERASVLGRAQASPGTAPPARFADRAVVARTAPPAPPVSFGARREAMQANPGRPLDTRTVETLRPNDRNRAPMAITTRPAAPAGAPMRPMTQQAPPPAAGQQQQPGQVQPRQVQPGQVQPGQVQSGQGQPGQGQPGRPVDRPMRPQQQQQNPPLQNPQPQNNGQPRPVLNDGPIRPERPPQRQQNPQQQNPQQQNNDQPRRDPVQPQQPPQVQPARPLDRPVRPPQPQNNDQPRRQEPPQPQPGQVQPPRSNDRPIAPSKGEQPRTERKQEKKKEDRKQQEEKKQQ